MPATGDAVNVKVALRCRPLSKKELSEGDRSIFTKDGNVARLQDPDGRQNGGSPIEFGFDHVYDADSTQLQVYEDVGKPVVDAAFQGFNTTVFAYGQTGSGKSWSMTGGKDEQRGLIPRINAEIFIGPTYYQVSTSIRITTYIAPNIVVAPQTHGEGQDSRARHGVGRGHDAPTQ